MSTTTTPTRRGPLPVLLAGTFMIVLDFFIVNVALPSMQRSLHASHSSLEWVVAGYCLTFSALLIIAGRLDDRVGRRRLLSHRAGRLRPGLGGLRPGSRRRCPHRHPPVARAGS
jgi:MFS family permease